jgi:suppressor of fused-like protein
VTDEAPGWDAIDARLAELYPDIEPLHAATEHTFALGGTDPLDGFSFYPRTEPVPHWHIVSYGMSELYNKDSDNPNESGWGFEFTLRVTRRADDDPPAWAAGLLQSLARYVFSSGNWFAPGHRMKTSGPLREGSALTALAFTEDPELDAIATPHGKVQFLQVVGLTSDEYQAVRDWNTEGVLTLLAEHAPLLVTDVDRRSIIEDPEIREVIERGKAEQARS